MATKRNKKARYWNDKTSIMADALARVNVKGGFSSVPKTSTPSDYWLANGEFLELPLLHMDGKWNRDWLILEEVITPNLSERALWSAIEASKQHGFRFIWNVKAGCAQQEGYGVPVRRPGPLFETSKRNLEPVIRQFLWEHNSSFDMPGVCFYLEHDLETMLYHMDIIMPVETRFQVNAACRRLSQDRYYDISKRTWRRT